MCSFVHMHVHVHGARTVNIVRKMAMDCAHFLFSYIAMLNWLFKLAHFAKITISM